jgi:3',5'-cyclic-AMP phosphodiesterase
MNAPLTHQASEHPVVFCWPGDMHLEAPDRENFRVAQWMTGEVNALAPDFVQFAGDNVQHAKEAEWALFAQIRGALKVPHHAIVGDHDAHHDAGCHAFRTHVGAPYAAFSLRGFRFIRLNLMESHPLGISQEQVFWFRFEVDAALARGERVVVFQHHYPFKVCETFDGPGIAQWREIVQTRPITAVFCGHTHYGQIANDGRNIYVATRSIGEPEGGPPGFAVVYLHDDDLAITYRAKDSVGPLALITHPRQHILCTKPAHVVSGPDEVRVRVWSAKPVTAVAANIDGGAPAPLRQNVDGLWHGAIGGDSLDKGQHTLAVTATDADGRSGGDDIVFQVDRSGRFTAVPAVKPPVASTNYC